MPTFPLIRYRLVSSSFSHWVETINSRLLSRFLNPLSWWFKSRHPFESLFWDILRRPLGFLRYYPLECRHFRAIYKNTFQLSSIASHPVASISLKAFGKMHFVRDLVRKRHRQISVHRHRLVSFFMLHCLHASSLSRWVVDSYSFRANNLVSIWSIENFLKSDFEKLLL